MLLSVLLNTELQSLKVLNLGFNDISGDTLAHLKGKTTFSYVTYQEIDRHPPRSSTNFHTLLSSLKVHKMVVSHEMVDYFKFEVIVKSCRFFLLQV